MPNYISNHLRIDGNAKDIKALREFIKGKDETGKEMVFDFEKVIPTPKKLLQTSPKNKKLVAMLKKHYGTSDYLEWHCRKWGTKWNLDNKVQLDWGKKWMIAYFDTAWKPPVKIIKVLAVKFPRLSFYLSYCGNGFAGEYEAKNKLIEDNYYDYIKDEEKYNEVAESHGVLLFEDRT